MGQESNYVYFILGLGAGYLIAIGSFFLIFKRSLRMVFPQAQKPVKVKTSGYAERQQKILVHDDFAAYDKELEENKERL